MKSNVTMYETTFKCVNEECGKEYVYDEVDNTKGGKISLNDIIDRENKKELCCGKCGSKLRFDNIKLYDSKCVYESSIDTDTLFEYILSIRR